MTRRAWAFAAAPMLCGVLSAADSNTEIEREILALERKTMEGWLAGNPEPALTLSDEGITYFHAVTNGRLDGLAAVRKLYETYRGPALFDSYEIVDPKVQVSSGTVVLTYVLATHTRGATARWNATQIYQRTPQGWRVIHAHFSMTNQPLAGP